MLTHIIERIVTDVIERIARRSADGTTTRSIVLSCISLIYFNTQYLIRIFFAYNQSLILYLIFVKVFAKMYSRKMLFTCILLVLVLATEFLKLSYKVDSFVRK